MADQLTTRGDGGTYVDHHFPVPHLHEAVAGVRRRAHALLADWGLAADTLEDALLVVSELITNAVLHALPPAVLRLRWSETEECGTLHIAVTDGGPAPREPRSAEETEPDEHGGAGSASSPRSRPATEPTRAMGESSPAGRRCPSADRCGGEPVAQPVGRGPAAACQGVCPRPV